MTPSMRSILKNLPNLCVLLAASGMLLLAAPGCGGPGKTTSANDAAIRAFVKVETVKPATVERTLELTALVQAGRAVDMVTDTPGKIKEISVKVGDVVKAGTVLARLDTDMARFQLEQADAASRLASIGAETAEREFGRAQALFETKSMTAQQFEQARAGLDMARLQKSQAEAMRGLANKQVRGGVLTAPFDGVISSVCCESGEYFNPMTISPMGGPQNLVGIVNIDTIKLDLQVSERDIGRIQKDMLAHILVDSAKELLPPEGILGRVDTVGLAADSAARTFPVRVVADNKEHLVKAGTHARVRIVLDSKPNVISVPNVCLQRVKASTAGKEGAAEQGSTYVITVVDGKARRVVVTTGLEGSERTEIKTGLQGGETLVIEGNLGLPDGASVDVSE